MKTWLEELQINYKYIYSLLENNQSMNLFKIYENTQEDFHGAFQKLLERYSKCVAAGGDYLEGD